MLWLPDGEKKLKISLFVLTQCTNVTDRHTQTPHDGIGRAYAWHRAAKTDNDDDGGGSGRRWSGPGVPAVKFWKSSGTTQPLVTGYFYRNPADRHATTHTTPKT